MLELGSSDPAKAVSLREDKERMDAAFDIIIKHNHMKTLEVELARKVYGLLRKYEFNREIDLCKYQLNMELVSSSSDSWNVFLKAANFEDHELCSRALSKIQTPFRPVAGTSRADRFVFGTPGPASDNYLDVRSLPRKTFDRIPVDSLGALMRASLIVERRTEEREDTDGSESGDDEDDQSSISNERHMPKVYSWQGAAVGQAYLRLMSPRGDCLSINGVALRHADE